MINICPPALIYLAFSLTQIIIDTFKGLYNTAFFKVIVMIIITILLNTLCQGGMSIISWIIVFVPFMFMSVIVGILLYVFGLDAATGTLKFKCNDDGTITTGTSNTSTSNTSNSTSSNSTNSGSAISSTTNTNSSAAPTGSSDPEYN
jgi:hypothetical protein